MTTEQELIKDLHQQLRDLTEKNKELQEQVDDIPNLIDWIEINSWSVLTDSGNWHSMIEQVELANAKEVYEYYLEKTA